MVERGIADPSVAGSNPVVPSFVLVVSCAVLWCNWLALWTLNPAIRVQIPVGPFLVSFFNYFLQTIMLFIQLSNELKRVEM